MKSVKRTQSKRIITKGMRILVSFLLAVAISIFTGEVILIAAESTESVVVSTDAETISDILITPTTADALVSPDKYNTGVEGELQPIGLTDIVNGVEFRSSGNDTVRVLDLGYRNTDVTGTVVFENLDFTSHPLRVYNEDRVDRDVTVIFRNCKFASMSTGRGESRIDYIFERCTFNNFYGSNASFEACAFGKSISDGMVPFQNITVNNCFFSNLTSEVVSEKEVHTDGIQIYGNADTVVSNVHYNNCRFEVPCIQTEGSKAYVNACIMLQLEFNDAKNVTFNNCRLNGGGYSIYAHAKGDLYTFENVGFNGIRYGAACKYGAVYTKYNKAISMNDLGETEYLYAGSVWKEDGETHISVTNDTLQERKLVVYTDKSCETFTIPACSGGSVIANASYEELPFDIDIALPYDCEYIVCYDATVSGYPQQIRFVNWTDSDVFMTQAEKDEYLGVADGQPLIEGMCGKDVVFSLSKDGILTLSGTGPTYDYHSGKPAPWVEYISYVKEINIEEGITRVGNQIFANCNKIRSVTFPEGLTATGGRVFNKCSSLTVIGLPSTLENLGDAICTNGILQKVYYNGSREDWSKVVVGKSSELVLDRLVYLVESTVAGDVNQDGELDLKDAQLTLKAALRIVSITEEQTLIADVDGQDGVGLGDAQRILKAALKIVDL